MQRAGARDLDALGGNKQRRLSDFLLKNKRLVDWLSLFVNDN